VRVEGGRLQGSDLDRVEVAVRGGHGSAPGSAYG
jgi:hypothetical protein